MNPKLKAALIAGAVAALAAGSRACVVAIADVDARADVDAELTPCEAQAQPRPFAQPKAIPLALDAGFAPDAAE